MNVVINTIPLLSPLTGVGKYTYEIAANLKSLDKENKYTYFYGYFSKKLKHYELKEFSKFYKFKKYAMRIPWVRFMVHYTLNSFYFWEKRNFDIYFEPNFIFLDSIKSKYVIVTLHDFSFYFYPEWHPKDRVSYIRKNFWKKIYKVDKIITVSNFIRETAVKTFNFPEKKIVTIYNGVNKKIFKCYSKSELINFKIINRSLPEKFILFVGSIEPRKNLKNLLYAYLKLDPILRREFKLVLAGFSGWQNKDIMNLLEQLKENVLYLGYLSENELSMLYNLATLFVYPSFYEGFGLPPLEAMACGCPVIVSNIPSLVEVCGDAAYYVDPYDVEDISEGLERMLIDHRLRESLVIKGLQRVKLFSWEKAALETLEVFKELV